MTRSLLKRRIFEGIIIVLLPIVPFIQARYELSMFHFLLFAVLLICVFVALMLLIETFRRERPWWEPFWFMLLFSVACWAMLGPAYAAGRTLRFNSIEPELISYVDSVQENLTDDLQPLNVPDEFSDVVRAAFGKKLDDDTTYIQIMTGGVFPVKHLGYIYFSGDLDTTLSEIKESRLAVQPINEEWMMFHD